MGVFRPTALKADPAPGMSRQSEQVAAPIGAVGKRIGMTATTFRKIGSEWFFGPEVPADFNLATRSFLRADTPQQPVNYFRYEVIFSLADAKSYGLVSGHRLVIADMPLGQRRFQSALLQKYAETVDTVTFEGLEYPGMPAGVAARTALSSDEVIAVLHRLPVNVFSSRRALTASIASTEAGPFVGYKDFEGATDIEPEIQGAAKRLRAELTARDRSKGFYSFGLISDLDTIRNDLWLHPRLRRILDSIGSGEYRVSLPGIKGSIAIPLEVAARSVDHFNVALFQALAGAGFKASDWYEKPVYWYVLKLFDRHLLAAVNRIDGDIIPPGSFDHDIPDIPFTPEDDDGDCDE